MNRPLFDILHNSGMWFDYEPKSNNHTSLLVNEIGWPCYEELLLSEEDERGKK